jgi:uncharacterized membrane protein YfcA
MMGIGGGTLSVPALTLMNQPVHRAVGTANLLGLAIAIPGTLGYLFARPVAAVPQATIGYVSLLSLLLLAPATVLAAPWGAGSPTGSTNASSASRSACSSRWWPRGCCCVQ